MSGLAARFGAAVVLGLMLAALPAAALAQEDRSRALGAPSDATVAIASAIGAVAFLLLLAALGYLYRRRRDLRWDFQVQARSDQHHGEAH